MILIKLNKRTPEGSSMLFIDHILNIIKNKMNDIEYDNHPSYRHKNISSQFNIPYSSFKLIVTYNSWNLCEYIE